LQTAVRLQSRDDIHHDVWKLKLVGVVRSTSGSLTSSAAAKSIIRSRDILLRTQMANWVGLFAMQ